MNKCRTLFCRFIIFGCLVSTASNVVAREGKFYLGGLLGQARGDVGAEEMNNRMADLGYDAQAQVSQQNRTAWEIFGGYQYSEYLGFEAGYIDLGEVRTRLVGSTTDINDYLNSANLVHPRSASGYELAALGRYPLNEKSYLYLRGGLLFASSRYKSDAQSDFAKRSDNGSDLFAGIGYGYELNDSWGLRLSFERYRVESEDIDLLGLGIVYKFYHHEKGVSVTPKVVAVTPVALNNEPEPVADPCEQTTPVKEGCEPALVEPVSIKLAVQFDTNSDVIKEGYLRDIRDLADFMRQHPNAKVTIEGHTDNLGNDQFNKTLSQRRAHSVRNVLVNDLGISNDRVAFVGYGEEKPIADNATEQGRAENRRVMAEVRSDNKEN